MPAVSTLISVVTHMTTSITSAATVSAMLCSSECVVVRCSVVGQRMHRAVMPRCSAGTTLEQPAARAFAQLRPRETGRPLRRDVVICADGPRDQHRASPSASWPTAVLIAATSPATSGVGGVHLEAEARMHRRGACLERHRAPAPATRACRRRPGRAGGRSARRWHPAARTPRRSR